MLPHEFVFGTFLLVTGIRLCAHDGTQGLSLIFFGCLASTIALVPWTERNSTSWRWRVRLCYCFVVMGIAFYALRVSVPLLGTPRADGLLQQWDRNLLGETPAVVLEPWLHPWAEDVAMAGYLFFFYYLLFGPGYYCFKDLPAFRRCIIGLFTMYGLAFTGYTLLPAGGPHSAIVFHDPLHGPWLLNWTLDAVNRGSNAVDAFPSVHVAASLYLLLFDWQHCRRRFWWHLAPCTVLWWSTIYLRFHYFVDLLAGVAVALVGWWVARHWNDLRAADSRLLHDHRTPG